MGNYKGQEKVKVLVGECKGDTGYVRKVKLNGKEGRIWVVLDNGRKLSLWENEVEFIHPHYFLQGIYKEDMLGNGNKSHLFR